MTTARRNTGRWSRRGLLAAGGAAAFLAACGGGEKQERGAAGTQVPGGAAGAQTQAQAVKLGGVLRYHIPKDPGNLDPHLATDSSTTAFANLVYNTLLRFRTGPEVEVQSLQIEGALAEKWETPDTQTVILKVRPGVKWQNRPPLNGRAFTAEDVKFGILRIGTDKPEFQRATFFKGIDRIDIPDKDTVVIKHKQPNVPFVTYLAVPYHVMISREVVEGDDPRVTMVGTGPFMLDSYTPNGKAIFKKNPDYWRKDARGQQLPYLDGVELAGPQEPAVRLDAFRAGQTDIIIFDKAGDAESVKRQNSSIQSEKFTPFFYYMVYGFDVTRGPLQDERVRQAIACVIDHAAIRRAIFQDEAVRATPIPVGFKDWIADYKELDFYFDKPDIQRGKQLMEAAGLPNGFNVKMDTNVAYTDEAATMPLLQDMLRKININVTDLLKIERAQFLGPTNRPGGFEMRLWHHSAFSEPDEFLTNFYQRGASRNYGGWGSERMDALINQQRNIADKNERKKVLVEIQKELARTNWRIGLEQNYEFVGWYSKVKGWRALAADPGYYTLPFEHTWLDR